MDNTTSVWLVIALGTLLANLPFINNRWLAIVPKRDADVGKGLQWRLLELVVLYFVVGGVGLALEYKLGQNAPQNWEFYAVTACLFATLAFPGFVYQYLWKKR
ncbi:DUF2818 family protein [Comamonadaceae bacterium M7527]|nr:DUF2818 family protein [Comamonadaceae bacterium M7527]